MKPRFLLFPCSHHSHFLHTLMFGIMLISILLKIGFIALLFLVVFPRFRAKRKLWQMLLETTLLLTAFLMLEFLLPPAADHQKQHSHNFPGTFWFQLGIYLLLLSLCLSIHFFREWLRNERLRNEMIKTQLSTELDFLKSQINPHFLFNTLNNLYSIAQKEGSAQTETGIYKLSGLMRYVIYETSGSRVPLEKEIGYLQDFIGLSRLRFTPEELEVSLAVEGPVSSAQIAPMILVPFVENAFKHGVKVETKSFIKMIIKTHDGNIIFDCVNSVHAGTTWQDQGAGIGLDNVKRRLQLLYPGKHSLETTESDKTFRVKLVLQS